MQDLTTAGYDTKTKKEKKKGLRESSKGFNVCFAMGGELDLISNVTRIEQLDLIFFLRLEEKLLIKYLCVCFLLA